MFIVDLDPNPPRVAPSRTSLHGITCMVWSTIARQSTAVDSDIDRRTQELSRSEVEIMCSLPLSFVMSTVGMSFWKASTITKFRRQRFECNHDVRYVSDRIERMTYRHICGVSSRLVQPLQLRSIGTCVYTPYIVSDARLRHSKNLVRCVTRVHLLRSCSHVGRIVLSYAIHCMPPNTSVHVLCNIASFKRETVCPPMRFSVYGAGLLNGIEADEESKTGAS